MQTSFADLKNKTAVITGGSGVIGFSIVRALAAYGVKTAVITRNKKSTEEKISSIENTIAVEGDVIDRVSLLKAKEEINKTFGKVDILINCAGGNYPKATTGLEVLEDKNEKVQSIFGLDVEAVNNVFHLNFLGTLLPVQVFAEDMVDSKNGVILNISSISSFRPLTKVAAYSAAKAAINNFTQWLSVHFAGLNI
ncbi:MAG: SDR family NAD(P)-dependent oxidoreductase, partial [Ignavibacteriales bacterium]